MIRDFIYYDKDKILSFGSQLLGGFTESVLMSKSEEDKKSKETSFIGKVDVDAKLGTDSSNLLSMIINKIGKLEVNAGTEASRKDHKEKIKNIEETSTKILDHYQFVLFRNALIENNLLKNLDEIVENDWHSRRVVSDLKPGDFIELSCKVKIFDKRHLEIVTKSVEKIMELMQQFDYSRIIQEKNKNGENVTEFIEQITENPTEIGYETYKRVLGSKIEPILFTSIIEFIKNISGGEITMVPMQIIAKSVNGSKKSFSFIAPVREEYLVDSRDELLFKYGYEPEQEWKMLAQICKIPKNEKSIEIKDIGEIDFSNIKSLDEIVEAITEYFMEISKSIGVHSSVKFPNISINLIGLYRE